jgi:hypothetical protein
MKRKQSHVLTAVLVDYDNIYLALRRKSEEAAKRFAKDAGGWLKEIETGGLITPTNSLFDGAPRRIVLNRCYGNPVPRRNTHDNSTDMSSFPFVRHHFLRSGFEVVDCPPLTAQLKNSSDIRMVMDIRDLLLHDTTFDEFVILSGDADFTPVLHRLRAHARRTVIFANDHTAVPYKAISDGEVRESDLIAQLLAADRAKELAADRSKELVAPTGAQPLQIEEQRQAIIAEALAAVSASRHPIPIDLLAERVIRMLGHESTIATGWAGAGSFRELLTRALPDGVRIGEQPPYPVLDTRRQIAAAPARLELKPEPAPAAPAPIAQAQIPLASDVLPTLTAPLRSEPTLAPAFASTPLAAIAESFAAYRTPQPVMPTAQTEPVLPRTAELPPVQTSLQPPAAAIPAAPAAQSAMPPLPPSLARLMPEPQMAPAVHRPAAGPPPVPPAPDVATASSLQQSIARIHDACQAPPLSPPEYRILFDVMAREIGERGLAGGQTLTSIVQRAAEQGVEVRRDDVRFVLEVVSETDPWFEQGASPSLFAGRFRNFVVARCRGQGLNLSADELDLIEAWFVAGGTPTPTAVRQQVAAPAASAQAPIAQPHQGQTSSADWRTQELPGRPAPAAALASSPQPSLGPIGHLDEEFPRIVRTRLRG